MRAAWERDKKIKEEKVKTPKYDKQTVESVLQMAVDYYTLTAMIFAKKYPNQPMDNGDLPFWVELAKQALASKGVR